MRLTEFRRGLLGQFVAYAVVPSVAVLAAVIFVNGWRGFAALQSMVERTATVHIRHGDPADDERIAASVGRAVWLAIYGDA